MKNLIILSVLAISCLHLNAQSYNTAAGMRLGTEWGLTVKQRVAKKTTIEAILQSSLQREEFTVTLLGEQHYPLITRRLNVYAGAGLHKGWHTATIEDPEYKDPFGLSFVTGIEFSLGRLNLSYDFKPAVNISGGEQGFYSQTAVSMRYIINKRKWLRGKNKNKKKKNKKKKNKEPFDWRIWKKKD